MLGILLTVLGILALVYQGFNYTRQKKVLDVGPIHASVERKHNVALPPLAGGAVLIAGVLLVVAGKKV
jgi:hypothetical protein